MTPFPTSNWGTRGSLEVTRLNAKSTHTFGLYVNTRPTRLHSFSNSQGPSLKCCARVHASGTLYTLNHLIARSFRYIISLKTFKTGPTQPPPHVLPLDCREIPGSTAEPTPLTFWIICATTYLPSFQITELTCVESDLHK